ncbi:bla regulator protein blaR1 [Terribacillus halophilus]|uniref:Bla regulator protein blaR1 n=1 Tax=Terribacillus halophilus TaxID=361279 RepID=A0A1G6JBH5_9BACI|nr:BlaR1 family beta-lactam sensor/signal transducer [Terribacillus halophilus]SDC15755.1 bla regulator protein blaR1 [Terribacillus halophilus]
MTFVQLLLALTLSSVTIGIILFIRRFFAAHLAPAWRYYLWFFVLGSLLLPFLPFKRFGTAEPISVQKMTGYNAVNHSILSGTSQTGWMNDFGSSVTRIDVSLLGRLINFIWISGIVIGVLAVFFTLKKLMKLVRSAHPIRDDEINELFQLCKVQLSIRKKIKLKQSSSVTSPFIFGLFHTYLILPATVEKEGVSRELKHVLLHELHHYKSRHVHWNYLFLLARILHWFNPLVWYAWKEMRLDREIACDAAVMQSLNNDEENLDYGRTILHYAEKSKQLRLDQLIHPIISSKSHLKQRILHITRGSFHAQKLIWKSVAILIVMGLVVTIQVPAFRAAAFSDEQYHIQDKDVEEEDLSAFLKGDNSSFVLYSMEKDKYFVHNKEQSVQRVSPNSTYKIYSALTALEAGIIQPKATNMNWDGSHYEYETWNQNQDLQSAMRNSVTWYFQNLDQQVGEQTIQKMLAAYHYGNEDISGGIEDFWLESSLRIAPFEQVELLRNFYHNKFNADPENIKKVKASLMLEQKHGAVLYGKTGTGIVNGKAANGWFIGFVETTSDTYFFATNLRDGNATGSNAAGITLRILKEKQIYQ